jgi:putative membrane protein
MTGVWPVGRAPSNRQLQRGAELMYYSGDISEILLAFALDTTWRPKRRRRIKLM